MSNLDENSEFDTEDDENLEFVDDRTDYEKQSDDEIEKIDKFFCLLTPGTRILIERLQPSWCAGILEEIVINSDRLEIDYFIEQWGGSVLGVKVRGGRGRFNGGAYKIPLNSYPPKVYGEIITKKDILNRNRGISEQEQNSSMSAPAPFVVNTPVTSNSVDKLLSALPALLPGIFKYFENSANRRQNELLMMMKLMNNNGGGINDIAKISAAMAQMQSLFANNTQNSDSMDILPEALNILKTVLGKENHAPPQRARLTTGSSPDDVNRVTHMRSPNIAASISQMTPQGAAETIIEALGRMAPDKQQQAIASFLTEYQSTMSDTDYDDEQGVGNG